MGSAASLSGAAVVGTHSGAALSYVPLGAGKGASAASRLSRAARPFDAFFTNLDYSGGPVMSSNTNYTIFWRPAGAGVSEYPAGYQTGLNTYFEDLAHDSGGHENVESIATQYNDAEGAFVKYDSHFGGTFVDEDPYPASGCPYATRCFTDEQLRTELEKFVSAHSLPADLSHEYFMLTPPGVESCFEFEGEFECSAGTPPKVAVFCAYHSNIPLSGGGEIVYANDPFVTGNEGCDDGNHPNGLPSDGAIEGGLSHEHNESVTDPEPNNAWTDWGEFTGEDGDKCRTFEAATEFGTPLGEVTVSGKKMVYNQEINGHKYWYQQEWSNKGHTCLQRLSFSPAEAPTATFSSAFEGGSTVKFDATGSTSGAGVHYTWQFNDFEGLFQNETVETTSPTITRKFPFQGLYTVALTVFEPDGTSIGTAREVLVEQPPTAAFSVTTPSPTAGSPVSFNASASHASVGLITSYAWDFGDGSSGSGVSPSHAFAAPGIHNVKLTVTDELGGSASATHAVEVVAPSGGGGGGGTGGGTGTIPITTTTTSSTTSTQTSSAVTGFQGVLASTPSAHVAGSSLKASSSGAVTLQIACATGGSSCAGSVTLRTATAVSARRAVAAKKAILTLGSASFSVAPGATAKITLHLSAKARALLARTHILHAIATIGLHGASVAAHPATATVTIRPAATHRRSH